MREFKFRYYDPSIRAMLTPSCVGEYGFYADDRDLKMGRSLPFDRLMQYTGLKDKNGKEIYEGDIIKWAFVNTGELPGDDVYYVEVVEWSECGFFLDGGAPLTVAMDDCEVLGNVYEHPDLLK